MGGIAFHVIIRAHPKTVSTLSSKVPFQCASRMPQHRSMGLYLLWYGGEETNTISNALWSTNATIRCMNWVRKLAFWGPLSRSITNWRMYAYMRQLVIDLDNGPKNASFRTQFMQ